MSGHDRRAALHPDPYDEAWREFCDALFEALGGRVPGNCQRYTASHHYARRLLEERGYDVEASIALYEKQSAGCDCEILANLDQPTLEDELDELTDELGDPITQVALDAQYQWIRERYGDEAAECANYGWGSESTGEEPLRLDIATKVYGHGILSTLARRDAARCSGFEVTHHFTPFGSPEDIASKRRVLEQMRQRFEAGRFDEDPPGAPPGAKERVRRWLEDSERELEELGEP